MSKTFPRTSWVVALLASGALLTACQSSSDTDRSERNTSERARERAKAQGTVDSTATPPRTSSAASPASEPVRQRSTTGPSSAVPPPGREAKAKTGGTSPGKLIENEASLGTSYGQDSAGAGITERSDTDRGIGGGGDAGRTDAGSRSRRK
jgi:hypothetical protein